VQFVGYLYITDLINARAMEHLKMEIIIQDTDKEIILNLLHVHLNYK